MERRIEGLIESSSAGSDGETWSLILFLRPWRVAGEPACDQALRVLVPMDQAEASAKAFRVNGTAVAFTLVELQPPSKSDRFGLAFGRAPLEQITLDAELRALADVEDEERSVEDPVLGRLVLERAADSYTVTRDRGASSYEISVEVSDPDDVHGAAGAIARARAGIERIEDGLDGLRAAIADELLDEYNDKWRGDSQKLFRKSFLSRLTLTAITAAPDGLTAWFECDGMFSDHGVQVRLSATGEITQIDIA